MNTDVMMELKQNREQMNNLVNRVEAMLLRAHEDNSNAIDKIIISILGGSGDKSVTGRVKKLYVNGQITKTQLKTATSKKLITNEEYDEILGDSEK